MADKDFKRYMEKRKQRPKGASGHTLDPGQRRRATIRAGLKDWERPKVIPKPPKKRPKPPGFRKLPYPLPKKPGRTQ